MPAYAVFSSLVQVPLCRPETGRLATLQSSVGGAARHGACGSYNVACLGSDRSIAGCTYLSSYAFLMQVGLLGIVKEMVFGPTVEVLYGAAFAAAQDMPRLQRAFFDFEAGFELAASPAPHWLQRSFCAARRHLLTVFRQERAPPWYPVLQASYTRNCMHSVNKGSQRSAGTEPQLQAASSACAPHATAQLLRSQRPAAHSGQAREASVNRLWQQVALSHTWVLIAPELGRFYRLRQRQLGPSAARGTPGCLACGTACL